MKLRKAFFLWLNKYVQHQLHKIEGKENAARWNALKKERAEEAALRESARIEMERFCIAHPGIYGTVIPARDITYGDSLQRAYSLERIREGELHHE